MAHPGDRRTPGQAGPDLFSAIDELRRHPPFNQMAPEHVREFAAAARAVHFRRGQLVVAPEDGPVRELFFIRRGAVTGQRGLSDLAGGAFQYEAGDLFPVSAVLAQRAPTTRYSASEDTEALAISAEQMQALAARSAVFGDFLNRRILTFLALSRTALQTAYASRVLAEQSWETPLAQLVHRAPVACAADTPLREVLQRMHDERVGAMVVLDAAGTVVGILTRSDVLHRVALAEVPLHTPVSAVMVQPVHTLPSERTAQEAALLMSAQGVRHVPVLQQGRLMGVVSERDLFALQRLSLKHVSSRLRDARDLGEMREAATEIQAFARRLLGQGVQAQQLTALISHLNDVLTGRLLELTAQRHGLDLRRVCWLALGSEGRNEQTIATDQDNALILGEGQEAAPWLAFAREVNEALDACGYPLCKGGIMASNPACCLTLADWRERFGHWIEHGSPQDLLNASIYFDFRALAGDRALAERLREWVTPRAQATPRFLRQLALNGLRQGAPLNWLGNIDTTEMEGRQTLDLKLQGTALVVDVARLYALANGVSATGTRERLASVGPPMGVPPAEHQAWIGAFDFLQTLRLRAQLDGRTVAGNPNRIAIDDLHDIDRRLLKEVLRVLRSLQQRVRLDYER